MTDSRNDAGVSTLILVDNEEYAVRASRSRVLFENYSQVATNLEQRFTLTLERSRDLDCGLSHGDASVPTIVSPLLTPRFELSVIDTALTPLEGILRLNVPRIYSVKFLIPETSESDYVWDNFQDQVVIHTRLSTLVVRLEAWKHKRPTPFPHDLECNVVFPASLPDVKAPPLRLFNAIEQNESSSQRHHSSITESQSGQIINEDGNHGARRRSNEAPLSRNMPTERQLSPFVPSSGDSTLCPPVNRQAPSPVLTTIQSQREAQEVILELRKRRTTQTKASHASKMSSTSVAMVPETSALDASTRIELEEFNTLINAAKDQVRKETAQAKRELAYFQQLLSKPVVPPAAVFTGQKPRKSRHLSATVKRPARLPALVRPLSEGVVTTTIAPDHAILGYNQELSPRNHVLESRRSTTSVAISKNPLGSQQRQPTFKRQNVLLMDESDDSEAEDAPSVPDEPTGVASLDAEDD